MEAAVADRKVGMTEGNDGRLDDLSQRVNRIEAKMDKGFARIEGQCDALQRSLTQIAWTFGVGMLTFAGALLGVIAAKF